MLTPHYPSGCDHSQLDGHPHEIRIEYLRAEAQALNDELAKLARRMLSVNTELIDVHREHEQLTNEYDARLPGLHPEDVGNALVEWKK